MNLLTFSLWCSQVSLSALLSSLWSINHSKRA